MIAAWLWIGAVSAHAAPIIEKVLPFTPEADAVRIVVTAKPGSEITATITPWKGKDVVWTGSLGKTGNNGEVEKLVSGLKVKPWSPGSPNLYELTVATGSEKQTVRFGFRKFEMKNAQFYLNGKPIFMRGLAIGPPGRGVPDATGMSRKFAHDYIAYLKKQNVNLIRVNEDSQDWFDEADEQGMMLDQGFYGSPPSGLTKEEEAKEKLTEKPDGDDPETAGNVEAGAAGTVIRTEVGKRLPKNLDKSYAAYRERFDTFVRHPSIVIYILSNELPFAGSRGKAVHEFLTTMFDRLKEWDHTRLYIGNAGYGQGHEGDINDVHRYWGWYYNTFATFFNLRDRKLFGDYEKNQPLTFSECIGNFTGPNGAYNVIERKQIAAQLCWTGYAPNQVEEAQARQRFTNKQVIEVFRRLRPENPRISGLMPFTIAFHNWRGITSFSQMKPTAAAEQFGISYSPVLLSFEHFQPQLYAGATTTVRAHVINDADEFSDLEGATLTWSLWSKEEKQLAFGKVAIPKVPYYGNWQTPIDLKLPDNLSTGDYELMGTIHLKGKQIAHQDTPIFIADQQWKSKPATGGKKLVLVGDNGTSAALKKLGISAVAQKDLSKLDPTSDCVIIGQEGWSKSIDKSKLKAFVEKGGRVLCLGQTHDKFDASWLSAKIKMPTVSVNATDYTPKERPSYDQMCVNPEMPDHPIFEGVERSRLRYWSDTTKWDQTKEGFPRIYPIKYGFVLTDDKDLGHVAILADYDRGLEGVALAEMFDGKGSVLMCALDLVPHVGIDPAADRMLMNLVNFTTGDAPHPIHRTADKKIVWGDYPSMQGFVSGPVQGFFINTVWVAPPTEPNAEPISNDKGWWNSRPSDQFVPRGIRARGPFSYTTNCTPRDGDKTDNGTGIFFAALPSGRKTVVTKIENPHAEALSMSVKVNDGSATTIQVPAGKTAILRAPLPADASDVSVRYNGSKKLVILETSFE